MKLEHSFTVPAPVEHAWPALLDIEGVAPCFPGATLAGIDGEEFSGTVKVKLGPVSLTYAGKGKVLERDDQAYRVVIDANGRDKNGNGTAGARVHARMEPDGAAATKVVVETDLKVTGRPAQFGRGVVQDVGERIIGQFADCLATTMAGADADAGAGRADDVPAATAGGNDPGAASAAEATGADLDLGAAVLPVLVRRLAPLVVAVVPALVAWWLVRRRRSRSRSSRALSVVCLRTSRAERRR